jgi:large conductance mechanosensitive channel
MLEEFKKFAMRGNVVDLAVGIVIGAAFTSIVNSLVADIFTPLIGAVSGGLDFSNYFLPLSNGVSAISYAEAKRQGAVLGYGQFVTVLINFLIVAWALFLVIRFMNRMRRQEDAKVAAEPKTSDIPTDVKLLAEIRDLLAARPPEGARLPQI